MVNTIVDFITGHAKSAAEYNKHQSIIDSIDSGEMP